MGKRAKSKTRSKSGRSRTPTKPDEVLCAGPLRMARFGRIVEMRSNWAPGEFERFRSELPQLRAGAESKLKSLIRAALDILRTFDPIELLAALFVRNAIVDPTTFTESSSKGREYRAEFVFSLLSALAPSELELRPPEESTLPSLEQVIDNIYDCARDMVIFEGDLANAPPLQEFRVQMLLRHMFIRGSSYPEHDRDLFRELAQPHGQYLEKTYGFTSIQLQETFDAIFGQIEKRVALSHSWWTDVREVQAATFAKLDNKDALLSANAPGGDEDALLRLRAAVPDDAKERLLKKYESLHKDGRELLVVNRSDSQLSQKVLETCSCRVGDNAQFLADPFAGYPTKETIIWSRPLLQFDNDLYCPSPVILARALPEVLENLLLRSGSYNQTYQAQRASALERLAVRYLRMLLPGAEVETNLYYSTGAGNRAETDAIVRFDRYVFIVEAKAGGLTLPARRGAPSRLRNDFAKIIEDAFVQGNRARDYILASEIAKFQDDRGVDKFSLNRSEIDEIYIVNPTLATMDPLGAQLGLAREIGLLSDGAIWPWCVFVNDLRVIAEILDSPAEFLVFLQRRLQLNSGPYAPYDELDMFCKFLDDGIYHETGELNGVHRFGLRGYTDMLDRWYIGRPYGAEVAKPARPVPVDVRTLVSQIETSDSPRRISAAICILELDQAGLDAIADFLRKYRIESSAPTEEHDLTLQLSRHDRGISLYLSMSGRLTSKALAHAKMRMRLAGITQWLAVGIAAASTHVEVAFLSEVDLPRNIDRTLLHLRQDKLNKYLAEHEKLPGRNDPCFCSSGKKFKKCCGPLIDRA